MHIKVSEATPLQLDWLVAKCEGVEARIPNVPRQFLVYLLASLNNEVKAYHPSSDWSQGGPIIERNALTLSAYCGKDDSVDWYAGRFSMKSPTPLIAAMRCYVYSELGDEVDIPKELL